MSTDLRWTHLTKDTVAEWSELTHVLGEVDGTEEFYEPEDLAEELEESGFDPTRDSWGVWADDVMIGYGQVYAATNLDREGRVRCHLGGGIHPDWRARGIGRELVTRQEVRAVELAATRHPGASAYLRADGGLAGSSARQLLTHLGYAVCRYFNHLTRPLPGDALAVPELDGVALICPGPEHESAMLTAHNAAFVDHWGSVPSGPESWHDYWTSRTQRWPVSTLAVDASGEVLAYTVCGQFVPRELYVAIVGTVPEARGRGLAAACLARTIGLATDSGEYDVIELDVDSDSLTGATRLYERLGFEAKRTTAAMQKEPQASID